MKLKTLKDLEGFMCRNHICKIKCHQVEHRRLRKEAIKWIKEDIEVYRNADIELPKGEQGIKIHNFIVARRQFWKDRFNITKEDLDVVDMKKEEGTNDRNK